MKLKTFHGRTMAEALTQVKKHFGKDAIILSTRTLTRGGILGIGGRPHIEITATQEVPELTALGRRSKSAPRRVRASLDDRTRSSSIAPQSAEPTIDTRVLSEDISALKSLVTDLVTESRRSRAGELPENLYNQYQALVQGEVAEQLAQHLIQQVREKLGEEGARDPQAVRAELAQSLASMLPTAGPIRLAHPGEPTVIALVGPTGVGKTTTVAKLAANFALREGRRVGLVTIDTYRIAAVEQLRTYAQIINVPLEVVTSPRELRDAVDRMADCDVVLIDTVGRSQRDTMKIKELNCFFDAVRPHEVHLVLSGTCGQAVLNQAIERFSEVGVDRVIFTKLDEAIGFGVIITCLEKANAKLSYVTTGQDVPDDIEVGEGRHLAALILGTRPEAPDPVDCLVGAPSGGASKPRSAPRPSRKRK